MLALSPFHIRYLSLASSVCSSHWRSSNRRPISGCSTRGLMVAIPAPSSFFSSRWLHLAAQQLFDNAHPGYPGLRARRASASACSKRQMQILSIGLLKQGNKSAATPDDVVRQRPRNREIVGSYRRHHIETGQLTLPVECTLQRVQSINILPGDQ